MPDSRWNRLETVVLTGSVEDLRVVVLPDSGAVLVVDCPEPHAALFVLRPRTNAAIVVLADLDSAGAAALVADGAEDVLPRGTVFSDVIRSARHAAARRQRGLSAHVTTEAPQTPVPLAGPIVPSAPNPVSPDPRDGGPGDMPPQLQAVGRLAGGVAHDFNNLLQVIGGSAEELVHELDGDDPRRSAAQAIVDAARRAATLTHQLLAFGRRQTLIATSIDLSTLITDATTHLRERVGPRVRIVTTLAADLPLVHADRSQILEVLANLADNATDAMSEGGTLSISTNVVEVDDALRRGRPWLRSGRYVRMVMADTGAGIEEHRLPHLFEPFYSTKEQWGGTGLGLSSVYGIIKQSGGFIWVESRVAEGTRVTILLPPIVEPAMDASGAQAPRGRVLLVEDDEGVRDLLVGVLTHYGYGVDAYATAEAALEHVGAFDLLLSDVLLPGINGPELARKFRRRYPDVPVLLMSGDTGHVVDPRELDARGFLQKPFTARTLVTRVEELLSRPKKSPGPSTGR